LREIPYTFENVKEEPKSSIKESIPSPELRLWEFETWILLIFHPKFIPLYLSLASISKNLHPLYRDYKHLTMSSPIPRVSWRKITSSQESYISLYKEFFLWGHVKPMQLKERSFIG